ncbi:Rrf2 family transcriptional regulator [Flavobacterium franklandianum]|uniref:Rrf2 family transcriptional regulator n=2 Tax=Flavobacterium TaxID=237 RepID=A0A3S0Q305_9FLAO|nr:MULTISPECIES: Rrf2 family transcriptional regulator [Flavobacterium]RTY96880.1 Rrf2 family transcriptional regulator [Flavobacterium bomense]TRX20620.1 Rrf2 family transcriptional regulator [Flavobacterium franklandianum]TRX29385.1 Rrf2 family transcriptional regulator [Flavobacterium franklandianum]
MFSKTCEYAIRACIFIATQSFHNKRVTVKNISEKIDSPKSFTAKILQILAKNNLVHSVQGIGGGFEIPKEIMNHIKLSQIVIAIDGDSIFTCCGLGLGKCAEIHHCSVHEKFKEIRSEIVDMLNYTNLEELAIDISLGESFLK